LRIPVALELDLLVVHGLLHLAGYDDGEPREARLMHQREREILEKAAPRLPPRLWRGLLPD
ncbi:MAG: rRNA maturation RNase YbeY, partial [Candidatus Rokubacteria bacterium]|nr:rRNA maturation RNase YbeY [Candidatus Rokubacteria bacterium]